MELKGIIFQPEEITDQATYALLPDDLKSLLKEANGMVAYQGGLHIRGCVVDPVWHALSNVLSGPNALHLIYPELRSTDIPFAQDCMGDQFFLRLGTVWSLMSETGDVEDTELELYDFMENAVANPVEFLSMEPLIHLLNEDKSLQPGELVKSSPSFLVEADHYVFEAVAMFDQLQFMQKTFKAYQADPSQWDS